MRRLAGQDGLDFRWQIGKPFRFELCFVFHHPVSAEWESRPDHSASKASQTLHKGPNLRLGPLIFAP